MLTCIHIVHTLQLPKQQCQYDELFTPVMPADSGPSLSPSEEAKQKWSFVSAIVTKHVEIVNMYWCRQICYCLRVNVCHLVRLLIMYHQTSLLAGVIPTTLY